MHASCMSMHTECASYRTICIHCYDIIVYIRLFVCLELENILTCADIAPVVTYLCHDSCKDSGSIIETLGGFVAKSKLYFSLTRKHLQCVW